MKLPKQAKPIMRNVSTAKIEGGICPSRGPTDSDCPYRGRCPRPEFLLELFD